MKRMLVAVVAMASSSLVACGTPEEALPAPMVATPSGAAVVDCGTFTLAQGEEMPETAARCLIKALTARQSARLHVTSPTVEGDPIPTTYLARTDGRVDVVTDARQDKFGAQTITRQTCAAPVLAGHGFDLGDCSDPVPEPN